MIKYYFSKYLTVLLIGIKNNYQIFLSKYEFVRLEYFIFIKLKLNSISSVDNDWSLPVLTSLLRELGHARAVMFKERSNMFKNALGSNSQGKKLIRQQQ